MTMMPSTRLPRSSENCLFSSSRSYEELHTIRLYPLSLAAISMASMSSLMNGLLMLAVTTPIMLVRRLTMDLAMEFGMYFISSQILRILSRVASPISGLPDSALDTVAYETSATLAMSFIVTLSM